MDAKSKLPRIASLTIILVALFLSAASWMGENKDISSAPAINGDFSDIDPNYEWIRFIGTEKIDALSEVREDGGGNIYILYDAFVVDEEDHGQTPKE